LTCLFYKSALCKRNLAKKPSVIAMPRWRQFSCRGNARAVLGRVVDLLDNLLTSIESPESGRVMYGERGLVIGCGDILAAIAASED
jgi:hypothetical protein